MEKNIELYLVEDHNHVLEPLYNNIGQKKLPFDEMLLLHLDSHSDLSSPKCLNADASFDKSAVFNLTSIENWILPALYNGHFNHVVWVKPFWTKESFRHYSEFFVGRSLTTGKICVSSTEYYFLSECIYEPLYNMDNAKAVKLTILTIDEPLIYLTKDEILNKLNLIIVDLVNIISTSERGYILDIDLDFFSTLNPFLSSIPSRCWDLMQKLYEFTPPKDLTAEQLINDLSESKLEDPGWIHEIGSGIDDCPLPHHVSTHQQICGLVCTVECLLERLCMPLAITIARSSSDDYCPLHQVESIQRLVLEMLHRLYANKIHVNVLYEA